MRVYNQDTANYTKLQPHLSLPELEQRYHSATVETWAQDEIRTGLKPVLRRVWAQKAEPVTAVVAQQYQ